MNRPVLQARAVVRHYSPMRSGVFSRARTIRAVDGVSIDLRRGETIGLVGESGSGKSTVGRLLLGLEPANAGQVLFEGKPLAKMDSAAWRHSRARMQMVYQDPLAALDRRLTVHQQIEEPLIIHRLGDTHARRVRARELLDAVGLQSHHDERYPHELSGGQRQRVVLARALATNPDVLVCDEPISALDVSIQAQIINLLVALQQKLGIAILFISHDLRAVRQIASRIAVMYLGHIVEEAPTADVLFHPLHPYAQALVSAVPDHRGLRRDRIVLKGEPPSPANRPRGCAFHPRCPLVVDVCSQHSPVLREVGPGKRVACHRFDDVKAADHRQIEVG
ncbi:dipeptide ABC transporter ATP binding subunit DppF [Chelatococcus asaccharovorans]|nr:dipeptide ABC transporter ATP binding subunit DppF [Chelatococcus asaccharovorans]CAH1674909.1 dipeptide ABC transporter ATP binding subunit DppF [Chelatococcus asaccharovorans]